MIEDNTPDFVERIEEWDPTDVQDFMDFYGATRSLGEGELTAIDLTKQYYIYNHISLDEFEEAVETILKGDTPSILEGHARETAETWGRDTYPIL